MNIHQDKGINTQTTEGIQPKANVNETVLSILQGVKRFDETQRIATYKARPSLAHKEGLVAYSWLVKEVGRQIEPNCPYVSNRIQVAVLRAVRQLAKEQKLMSQCDKAGRVAWVGPI